MVVYREPCESDYNVPVLGIHDLDNATFNPKTKSCNRTYNRVEADARALKLAGLFEWRVAAIPGFVNADVLKSLEKRTNVTFLKADRKIKNHAENLLLKEVEDFIAKNPKCVLVVVCGDERVAKFIRKEIPPNIFVIFYVPRVGPVGVTAAAYKEVAKERGAITSWLRARILPRGSELCIKDFLEWGFSIINQKSKGLDWYQGFDKNLIHLALNLVISLIGFNVK